MLILSNNFQIRKYPWYWVGRNPQMILEDDIFWMTEMFDSFYPSSGLINVLPPSQNINENLAINLIRNWKLMAQQIYWKTVSSKSFISRSSGMPFRENNYFMHSNQRIPILIITFQWLMCLCFLLPFFRENILKRSSEKM